MLEKNEKLSPEDEILPRKLGFQNFYLAAFFASIGGMAMGSACGYSSPALPSMAEPGSGFEPLNDEEKSWVASILAIGALIGGLIGGPIIERFGRKFLLVAVGLPFIGGWLMIGFTGTYYPMLAGRLITGLCSGMVTLTIPVYISETAPAQLRGFLGSFMVLGIFIGVTFCYVLGTFFNWSWLAVILTILPLICTLSMTFMPESPRWLIKKGHRSRAISAVRFLNGSTVDPEVECRQMEANALDQPTGSITLREALQPSVLKPLVISLTIMWFQQWTGFNGVLFYSASIFQDAGYNTISPATSSIILAVSQTVGTAVSSVVIDKAGRKILLLVSFLAMIVSLTILSVQVFMVDKYGSWVSRDYGWITVLSLCVYVTFFALGVGSVPWVVMSEILPVRFRGAGSSLTTAFCWGNGFLVAKTFNDMRSGLTVGGAYLFYDVACVFGCVFVALCLPETKGKSLEELERFFGDKKILCAKAEDEEKL